MRKRAFTIVELAISIALLGTIMAAVMSLFAVGLKNYQRESLRNQMQKELNFTADDIGIQIRQAADSPLTFGADTRSSDKLILAMPAVDSDEDFIYNGGALVLDHVVYYSSGSTLYKKVISNNLSAREDKEQPVLESVSNLNCSYTPNENTEIVTCNLTTSRSVAGQTLTFNAGKTARLRNQR